MIKKIVFFDALNEKAKEKAREWYRSGMYDDDMGLSEILKDFITEKIKESGYILDITSIKVRYNLSYSQGDGVSFSCTFSKGEHNYEAYTSNGKYVHEMTMDVKELLEDYEEEDAPKVTEHMRKIAKEAEKVGYKEIEYQESDEVVDENILANEYTFTLEGDRINPDVL